MTDRELLERLRIELPRLLREHPEVRHEVWGLMLEAFPSRQEFLDLLQEIRAAREESIRRFEAIDRRFEELRTDMDRRFEELRTDMDQRFTDLRTDMDRRFTGLRTDMDRRFEAVLGELRGQQIHLSALGGRVGLGLEHVVKSVVEEFAGERFGSAQRLTLVDEAGEVFGVPGAKLEFDLYAHDGSAYLIEVKSHVKSGDVLAFHRKAQFARARLGRPLTELVIALSMDPEAETLMRRLGMRHLVRAVMP